MNVEWQLLRILAGPVAQKVHQLLSDGSAKRVREILETLADTEIKAAWLALVDAEKLVGPPRESRLEAAANSFDKAFIVHQSELSAFRPWQWQPEHWEKFGKMKQVQQRATNWLAERRGLARHLQQFGETAAAATRLPLLAACIYWELGNRQPLVQDRVARALKSDQQYINIQNELFDFYGANIRCATDSMGERPDIDLMSEFSAQQYAKDARSLHRATVSVQEFVQELVEALTGEPHAVPTLDTSRYPNL
ncbi:hypothetical protein ACPCUV_35970 [Streptomyces platensis]|uniref:hypothetical protein n=1 Tax=Streptomyces platensis TaxID=58346 RepID=UPI003C2F028A